MKFTPEELAEMAAADEEIEASFTMTQSEIDFSRQTDKAIRFESLTGDKQKLAAQQKAYREANREKLAAQQKAYREANREKLAAQKKAYREANREKYNAYMREYMRSRRLAKREESGVRMEKNNPSSMKLELGKEGKGGKMDVTITIPYEDAREIRSALMAAMFSQRKEAERGALEPDP